MAMGGKENVHTLLERIRGKCTEKNIHGIRALAHVFRVMDTDFNQALCLREFRSGLVKFELDFGKDELVTLFKHFDKDKNGQIDFREFLHELRPPMSASRVSVIQEAFNKLDCSGDGFITMDDLTDEYRENAHKHPKYQSGEWDEKEVFRSFLEGFETPGEKDGIVTKDEFMNYYAAVSSTVVDDQYFDLMMRSCWKLPPRKVSKENVDDNPNKTDAKKTRGRQQ